MAAQDSEWQKVDPDHNCFRVYSIRLELDLFGPYRVCCQWGRMGSRKMRRLIRAYGCLEDAENCIQRAVELRLKKGYVRVGDDPNALMTA